MFLYVTAKIIFQIFQIFLSEMPWVAHFLNEVTETTLWASVCYTFRLQLPNPFITDPIHGLPAHMGDLGDLGLFRTPTCVFRPYVKHIGRQLFVHLTMTTMTTGHAG